MKQQTICVLGGTGFVGSHLVNRLAQERHHIKVLTRRRERHRDLLVIPTLQLVEADIHDVNTLKREFEGCDAVINLVGILNAQGRNGRQFFDVHVELPRKVVEACHANRIKRLLHMSALGADAAYGLSYYQRTKGEGENLIHSSRGLQVTSFRPSIIFGPGDSFFTRFANLLTKTPLIFPLACPNTRYAPVYVGDVSETFARALGNHLTHGQRYELCGPRSYTLKELVEYTARVAGVKRKVIGLGTGLSLWQADLLEWFPGKPFSRDNFLSMQRDNVSKEPFPAVFGIRPASIESIVPTYLRACNPAVVAEE